MRFFRLFFERDAAMLSTRLGYGRPAFLARAFAADFFFGLSRFDVLPAGCGRFQGALRDFERDFDGLFFFAVFRAMPFKLRTALPGRQGDARLRCAA